MEFPSLTTLDKGELFSRLREKLTLALISVTAAQRSSQEGATHEENRSESDKDMRATEASYVARGQAERVHTLQAEIAALSALPLRAFGPGAAVASGALVRLLEDERVTLHWVLPGGGGESLESPLGRITILTTRSPLGQNLLGAHVGDIVGLDSDTTSREFEVLDVG